MAVCGVSERPLLAKEEEEEEVTVGEPGGVVSTEADAEADVDVDADTDADADADGSADAAADVETIGEGRGAWSVCRRRGYHFSRAVPMAMVAD